MVSVVQNYRRAPITEAVIEFRFAAAIEDEAIAKVSDKLSGRYPVEERLADVTYEIRPEVAKPVKSTDRFRRASNDRTELAVLTNQSFSVSQLAPYCGWETFKERFREAWDDWKAVVGYRKITRVGVRYINRIDAPLMRLHISKYLRISPSMPDQLGDIEGFTLQVVSPYKDGLKVVINSATVPSPLVNHISLLLDIDLSREVEIPQKDEGLLDLLDRMREKKNDIFESCITDAARALFQ